MQSPNRKKAALGLALVLGLGPACAGSSPPPAAPVVANPRAPFIPQIDQLCLDMYKKQQDVIWPTNPKEYTEYMRAQAEVVRDFLAELAALELPEDGKELITQMQDAAARIADEYDRLAREVDDPEAIADLQELVEDLAHDFNVAALQYGLIECSEPRPGRVY